MIPLLIPPLTGLQVLVTRPASQAEELCTRINELGGTALRLPVLTIKPIKIVSPTTRYDLLIFISTNAVMHGADILKSQVQARIAAVGAATAQALTAAGHAIDVMPQSAANSESLLQHPLLQTPPGRILIVRGQGGRELLRDTLIARGAQVAVAEVYARAISPPDTAQLDALTTQLGGGDIDIISITSVEILHALTELLDDQSRALAQRCTLLTGSSRIAMLARQQGWMGECIIATSPEDNAMMAALTQWHTRARN
jgi:uroporphyrinogen-III synthase